MITVSTGGRGNAGRSASHRETQAWLNLLPKQSLSIFTDSWTEITKIIPYKVVSKDQYNELENGDSISEMYLNISSRVIIIIRWKDIDVNFFNISSNV